MTLDRARRHSFVWLLGALCGIGLGLVTGAGYAQTADQVKAFQSLPKDQRDAILQQGGAGKRPAQSGQTPTDETVTVRQPPLESDMADPFDDVDPRTGLPRERRISGGEQLLIGVELGDRLQENPPDHSTLQNGRQVKVPDEDEVRRLSPTALRHVKDLRDLILKNNPYELSRDGELKLPGLAPISLAGLTRRQVRERLQLDPQLQDYTVSVNIQRLNLVGAKALKPFGYEIFLGRATAFVPGTDIPVPADYQLAPGDVMDVELYGQKTGAVSAPIGRDGTVSLPELGPVNVAGMSFASAKAAIEKRVSKQLIGTQVRVNVSNLRATRVFVLGDAERPGSYIVSGLSTVTAALFASGGVKSIGSLRNIEVKRNGKLIRRLDLYDVLLSGDTSNDVRLEAGDVVFVPPVGQTVGIDGEVRRPAIYEIGRERSLAQVVELAGGLNAVADRDVVTVERISEQHQHSMISVRLNSAEGSAFALQSGDIIRVGAIRPVLENSVTVSGNVHREGTFQFRPGMLLSHVLRSLDDLKPNSDIHYLFVRREDPATRKVSVLSADLAAALANPGGPDDLLLAARDRITVFDMQADRSVIIASVMQELRRQSAPEAPANVVTVAGLVNARGIYPLEPGMRVSDLVRAGGGLQDGAYEIEAELTRYSVSGGDVRTTELFAVDLTAALHGDSTKDTVLKPYDILTIKQAPEWGRVETVEIIGEVRFPGQYQLRHGETLRSVLGRAGDLTTQGFAQGAIFTREDLKKRERAELDRLAVRLQADISSLALQNSQNNPAASQALPAGQALLTQLQSAKPVGRLVIDLNAVLASKAGSAVDIALRDGDRLVVPRTTQEVSVLGEVQSPTSHLYKPRQTRDDVIRLSGGMTPKADRSHIYVVRANGSVVGSSSGWANSGNIATQPGDTVVVPLDAEKMRPLTLWTSVTTIIYNLAIAAAAIGRF